MTLTSQQYDGSFQYAQTLRGITERIVFQLGDSELGEEFDSFDEKWVQARVIDTMKWLQGRKPSLFATDIQIELEPGESHQTPEGCDKLFDITQITDEKGKHYPVCEGEYKDIQASRRWAALIPQCMTGFPIFTYAFSPANPDQFILDPNPVKPVTVTATCSDVQQFLSDPDKLITCEAAKYLNTIVEYVLYQAMSMDSENVTIAALAESHRRTFFDLAPIRRREPDAADS